MILIDNFAQVAAQIETERGISKEEIQEAIELALVSACRKKFPESAILVAELDNNSGEVKIYQKKTAVKKVEDEAIELLTKEAKKLDPAAKLGTEIKIEVTPSNFGRIAAQTAKQVIIQRIREAEKNNIFEEFQKKIGQIIVGSVQRIENNNYLINLGRIEALLRYKDQIPEETYRAKDKIRVFISDIIKTPRGPMVQISRTHPNFLKKLMELEVPEITEGLIEIIKIAREPGKRAKIAVKSNHASISAVGTCVGPMGGRIQSVIRELHNEKIDVIE
ncbi:transcription termination factor NusA, partial [bacterium]|nr:transcription termination factor NusA [bacterium]